MTRRVWGYVNQDETTIAAYSVEWTPGHVENAANFDLIVGAWGPDTSSNDRKAVALDLRRTDTGPWFTVTDASKRPVATSSLVGEALSREQVIGKPIADTVFAICDIVWLQDHRLDTVRNLFSDSGPETRQVPD